MSNQNLYEDRSRLSESQQSISIQPLQVENQNVYSVPNFMNDEFTLKDKFEIQHDSLDIKAYKVTKNSKEIVNDAKETERRKKEYEIRRQIEINDIVTKSKESGGCLNEQDASFLLCYRATIAEGYSNYYGDSIKQAVINLYNLNTTPEEFKDSTDRELGCLLKEVKRDSKGNPIDDEAVQAELYNKNAIQCVGHINDDSQMKENEVTGVKSDAVTERNKTFLRNLLKEFEQVLDDGLLDDQDNDAIMQKILMQPEKYSHLMKMAANTLFDKAISPSLKKAVEELEKESGSDFSYVCGEKAFRVIASLSMGLLPYFKKKGLSLSEGKNRVPKFAFQEITEPDENGFDADYARTNMNSLIEAKQHYSKYQELKAIHQKKKLEDDENSINKPTFSQEKAESITISSNKVVSARIKSSNLIEKGRAFDSRVAANFLNSSNRSKLEEEKGSKSDSFKNMESAYNKLMAEVSTLSKLPDPDYSTLHTIYMDAKIKISQYLNTHKGFLGFKLWGTKGYRRKHLASDMNKELIKIEYLFIKDAGGKHDVTEEKARQQDKFEAKEKAAQGKLMKTHLGDTKAQIKDLKKQMLKLSGIRNLQEREKTALALRDMYAAISFRNSVLFERDNLIALSEAETNKNSSLNTFDTTYNMICSDMAFFNREFDSLHIGHDNAYDKATQERLRFLLCSPLNLSLDGFKNLVREIELVLAHQLYNTRQDSYDKKKCTDCGKKIDDFLKKNSRKLLGEERDVLFRLATQIQNNE